MTDWVVGVDEVGKGAFAGPMLIVAFAAPADWSMEGLKDSKKYIGSTARQQRKLVANRLLSLGFPWTPNWVEAREIDELGMDQAHRKGLQDAADVCALMVAPLRDGSRSVRVIVDGENYHLEPWIECVPRADSLFPQVSAASVIAKVMRDEMMADFDAVWPGYDFANASGYGTPKHINALAKLGPCPLHRRSFAPIRRRILEGCTPKQLALPFRL